MASSDPLALLQVLKQTNGRELLRIHVSPELKSTKSFNVVFDTTDPSCLSVILNLFLDNDRHEQKVRFPGVTLKDSQPIIESSAFNILSRLDVQVALQPKTLGTPSIPNFAKVYPTSFALICRTCQGVLADPRPEYIIGIEDSDALLESARGCCRYHCGAHRASNKPSVEPGPPPKRIYIDHGCPVVEKEYLKDGTVCLQDGGKITCKKCKTVIGRRRGLTGDYEFELFLVDFEGDRIMSMFGSEMHYLVTRILNCESHTYVTICDYDDNYHILTGLQSLQKISVVKTVSNDELTADLALSNLFTMEFSIVNKGYGTKVYFPHSIIKRVKEIFAKSYNDHKTFRLNIGIWKFSLIPIV